MVDDVELATLSWVHWHNNQRVASMLVRASRPIGVGSAHRGKGDDVEDLVELLLNAVLAGPDGKDRTLASGQCLAELAEAVEDESCGPATAVDTHRQLVGFGRGHKLPPI